MYKSLFAKMVAKKIKYIHTKIYNKQERKQKRREIRNKQYSQHACL